MEEVSSVEHEGICVLQSFFNMKMDRNKPMIIVKNTMETKRQCENLELLYVIRGEMSLVIEKKEYHFQEKDMVVLQPGTWYSWKTGDDEKEILLCKIMMEPYQDCISGSADEWQAEQLSGRYRGTGTGTL